MEWLTPMLLIIGSFIVLMFIGMPVAFSFLFVNIVGVFILWGGESGFEQLILSIYASVVKFTLLTIIFFSFMGEIMFLSGMGPRMLDALNTILIKVPGRLSLLAVAGGALFSTMSGATIATTALLGDLLVPEMRKRGYRKSMSLGPILGSGGLAMMIPPTGLGILLAALGEVSIGKFLIAILLPGVLLAVFYAAYIIIRCQIQPYLAPSYDFVPASLSQKLVLNLKYVFPLSFIVFLVLGLIFLGVATPAQSAAMGAVGTVILSAVYTDDLWGMLKKSIKGTTRISGMIFLIICGAQAFSQILAFSGATRGLVNFALGLPLSPILVIISMQIVVMILGCFIDPISIMMLSLPIFMPIVKTLGFDSVWFAVLLLLNIEMAQTSPPFGFLLFVMKGVAPPDTTIGDIYGAALPFLGLDLLVMILMIAFPGIALWLPNLM